MLALLAFVAASPVPAASRQLVLSVSETWVSNATRVETYERPDAAAGWKRVGAGIGASLGRTGLAWGRGLHPAGLQGPAKAEGDGKSPAGIFDLRVATGYAAEPPAGIKLEYRRATATLRCVDDRQSPHYNQLVDEATVQKDWSSAEDMRRPDDLYRLVVWVGHNDSPVVSGGGSCIFLHLRSSPESTTAGCTAFDAAPMEALVGWLDPAARPVLVQLPGEAYRMLREAWGLPAPSAAAVGSASTPAADK